MSDFIFRKYKGEDKEQVLVLLGANLWHFPHKERLAYFNWKYEQNPYTDTPLGFVCVDGDKIIAFRGYMLQPICINDKVFYNAALADTVTDVNYRRMGLFSRITKFSIEELDKDSSIVMSTNSSSGGPTLNGYLKLGWQPLTERKNLFSFSCWSLFPKTVMDYECCKVCKNHKILLTTECKATEMSALAKEQTCKKLISVHTDKEYLKWRFKNPHSSYYFAYYYEHDNLQAYVVIRRISGRKYEIVDLQYENKLHLKKLINHLHQWLRAHYIQIWTVNENDIINQFARSFKFYNLSFIQKWIKHCNVPPFLIRTMRANLMEDNWSLEGVDIRNNSNYSFHKIVADEV